MLPNSFSFLRTATDYGAKERFVMLIENVGAFFIRRNCVVSVSVYLGSFNWIVLDC